MILRQNYFLQLCLVFHFVREIKKVLEKMLETPPKKHLVIFKNIQFIYFLDIFIEIAQIFTQNVQL